MYVGPAYISLVLLSLWLSAAHSPAEAQTAVVPWSRQAIIEHFVEERQKSPAIYQSPPITHVVPNFNTITYAGYASYMDLSLYPGDDSGNVTNSATSTAKLKLNGYTASPHLAMSLKRVGLGFSVESMRREAVYTYSRSYYEGSPSSGAVPVTMIDTQTSSVDASGYGFNISLLPFPKFSKAIKLATILGVRSLNAKHTISPTQSSSTSTSPTTSFENRDTVHRYNVQKYELGINLSLQLLKGFRVIPWVDYTETVIQNNATIKETTSSTSCTEYECDIQLFWFDTPKLRYGVDVGLYIGGFEVRIGGLLGTLANLNATPAFIEDDSLTIGLSWDQKGG